MVSNAQVHRLTVSLFKNYKITLAQMMMKISYGLSEKKAVVKVNQNNVASVARLCK